MCGICCVLLCSIPRTHGVVDHLHVMTGPVGTGGEAGVGAGVVIGAMVVVGAVIVVMVVVAITIRTRGPGGDA